MTDEAVSKPQKNELLEWVKALFIAVVIVLLVRWLAFSPFIVDGDSMLPNFTNGERMIVNKLVYHIREPERGEVIVFLAPEGKDYIKRVIGQPGDRVRIEGDYVFVNGEAIDEPYLETQLEQARQQGRSYNNGMYSMMDERVVPDNSLFVLGDNRPRSRDSRSPDVGFVPVDNVIGRADVVYWPLSQFRFISHKDGISQ